MEVIQNIVSDKTVHGRQRDRGGQIIRRLVNRLRILGVEELGIDVRVVLAGIRIGWAISREVFITSHSPNGHVGHPLPVLHKLPVMRNGIGKILAVHAFKLLPGRDWIFLRIEISQ
jgi:hypothetical protein